MKIKSYFIAMMCLISLGCPFRMEANKALFFENQLNSTNDCEQPIYHEFWDNGCYIYNWNNEAYTSSGNYTQAFVTAEGCDSIVTLHLTMHAPQEYEYYISACGSYSRNGITYTESGTYHQPFYLPEKCDSIITLHITIKPKHNVHIYEQVCEGHIYEGNGFYIPTDGLESPVIRSRTYTSSLGCDSVVTMNLTLVGPEYDQRDIVVCGFYEWDGIRYYNSGSYTRIFPNQMGCDSVVTLNITILPNSYGDEYADDCESFTWYGQTYTESGNYQTTLNNSIGCDSIVTLHLTIHGHSVTEIYDEICEGEAYSQHGFNVSASETPGLVIDTLDFGSSIHLCDSLRILYLTIHEKYNDTIDIVSCGPYTWNEQTYPISGKFCQYFTDQYDCDSIVTINLFVSSIEETHIDLHSCGPTYYEGTFYFQNGTYTKHFTSMYGCDSVVYLHYTNHPEVEYFEYDTIPCENPFYWGGEYYSEIGSYTKTFESSYGCDSVVTLNLLGFGEFVFDEFSVVACEYFTWNDITYTQSGNYIQVFQRPYLCDSTVTLHLSIGQPNPKIVNAVACDSYTYRGVTYTQTGQYFQYPGVQYDGCDSVIEINVEIYPKYETVFYDQVCRGVFYDQHGFEVDTENLSGTITRTQYLQSINECDSVVKLYLTILPTHHYTFFDEICKGETYIEYGFNIQTDNLNGTIVESLTFPSILGCDSLIELHLTILPSYNITIEESGCDSIVWNGEVYTTSGSYTQEFTTVVDNCDSIVTKVVTINHPTSSTEYQEACKYYSWYGTTYSSSGVYEHTVIGENGCDSIITLDLTIHPTYTIKDTVHSCGPYFWDNQEYLHSGEVTKTFLSQYHCDSTVIRQIFIHEGSSDIQMVESCGPYVWGDEIFEESGVYLKTFTDMYGCDSTITLILTVHSHSDDGRIIGPSYVNISQETHTSIAEYEVVGLNASNYIWEVSNKDWLVAPNGAKCVLYITTHSEGILTVKGAGNCEGQAQLAINSVYGIDDYDKHTMINIYPNPTDGDVSIKLEGIEGSVNVKVMDFSGKLIDSFYVVINSDNNTIPYSFNKFNKGVYMIVITNNKNSFVNKVIIK